MARGHPPPHCENTQVLREAITEDDDGDVQKVERDAYWRHVSNIFTFENDPSDPDSNKSGKIKKLWSFVKS